MARRVLRERYVVSAPLTGTLLRIDLKAGDLVEPGMVIVSVLPNRAPQRDPRARQQAEQRLGTPEATVARAGYLPGWRVLPKKRGRMLTVPAPWWRKAPPDTANWRATHSRCTPPSANWRRHTLPTMRRSTNWNWRAHAAVCQESD